MHMPMPCWHYLQIELTDANAHGTTCTLNSLMQVPMSCWHYTHIGLTDAYAHAILALSANELTNATDHVMLALPAH